jgi:hypothetical protein
MTDSNDTFLSQYSNSLQSSREILLNIVRLLELQDETMQRNMILQANVSLRRDIEQFNTSRNRTSFINRPRTRNWRYNSVPLRTTSRNNNNNTTNNNTTNNNTTNNNTNTNINEILNHAFSGLLDTPLNPVVVRASPEVISQATENLLFSELPNDIQRYHSCPVSHEPFTDNTEITRIRSCGHYFSRPAFQQWFDINVHCPICRQDIRNNIPNDDNSELSNSNSSNNNNTLIDNSQNPIRNIRMSEASGQTLQDFVNTISNDINNNTSRIQPISYQFDFIPENINPSDSSNNIL